MATIAQVRATATAKRASNSSSKGVVAGSVSSNPSFYTDPSNNYHTQTSEYSEADFNAAMEAAKAEQKKYFDLQKTRTNEDADTKIADYTRLIGYANTDLTRTLEQNNTTFSRAMSRAANAYGTRGILFSGMVNTASRESASDYNIQNDTAKDNTNRTVTGYNSAISTTDRERNRKNFDLTVEADNAAWYTASKKLGNADEKQAADNRMKLYNKF